MLKKRYLTLFAFIALACQSPGWAATTAEPPGYEQAVNEIKCGHCGSAHKHLLKLAQNGHAKSQTLVAMLYEDGIGVKKDTRKAIQWYEKAAGKGVREAENRLGHLYLNGEASFRDPHKAAIWLERAADHGVMVAQRDVGMLYLKGDLVEKDHDKAVSFLRRAADQGSDEAREAINSIPGAVAAEQFAQKEERGFSQGLSNIEQSWEGYADIEKSMRDNVGGAIQLTTQ